MLTEFFAITDMTTNPDPILSSYHVSYVVWAPDTPLSSTCHGTRAGVSWTARPWPWSSPGAEPPTAALSRRSVSAVRRRRLDAPDVAFLVGPAVEGAIAQPVQQRGEQFGLVASDLEEQPPPLRR